MALKIRRGATVPALEAGEPFFDGNSLFIGNLNGSENKEIGAVTKGWITQDTCVETQEELVTVYTYTITRPGIYIIQIETGLNQRLDVVVDMTEMSDLDFIKIYNPTSSGFENLFLVENYESWLFADHSIFDFAVNESEGSKYLYLVGSTPANDPTLTPQT